MSGLLVDTHLLLWAALDDPRLPDEARRLISEEADVAFSTASVWEVASKQAGGRRTDMPEPGHFRSRLLAARYRDIPILTDHAIEAGRLPPVHRDPFDRIMIAQARVEGLSFLTADRVLERYGGPIRIVR